MGYYAHSTAEKAYHQFSDKERAILEASLELIPNSEYSRDTTYKLVGVGAMFNGTYNFKSITHTINADGYSISAEAKMMFDSKGNSVVKGYSPAKPTAKPKAPVKTKGDKIYVVKKGDTLSHIAQRFCKKTSDWREIEKVNRAMLLARDKRNKYMTGHWIFPGQKIKIPGRLLK